MAKMNFTQGFIMGGITAGISIYIFASAMRFFYSG